jgi:hypothetical protein
MQRTHSTSLENIEPGLYVVLPAAQSRVPRIAQAGLVHKDIEIPVSNLQ